MIRNQPKTYPFFSLLWQKIHLTYFDVRTVLDKSELSLSHHIMHLRNRYLQRIFNIAKKDFVHAKLLNSFPKAKGEILLEVMTRDSDEFYSR